MYLDEPWRRHTLFRIARGNPPVKLALATITRDKSTAARLQSGFRPCLDIQSQSGLSILLVRAMALVTGIGQQGTNVPVKVNLRLLGYSWRRQQQETGHKGYLTRPPTPWNSCQPIHTVAIVCNGKTPAPQPYRSFYYTNHRRKQLQCNPGWRSMSRVRRSFSRDQLDRFQQH